jgi:hypothetical protein
MNGTISIDETIMADRFLRTGDSHEMQFMPLAGLITADVGWAGSLGREEREA